MRLLAIALTLIGLVVASPVLAADPAPPGDPSAVKGPRAAGDDDVKVLKDVSYGPHVRNVMDIYLPQGGVAGAAAGPRPVIVCIHGGGWAGGSKDVYAWLGDALARRGYVAVSVTYRFAPQDPYPAQVDDVQRAVRWLRHHAKDYGIDPARVGAIGGSAGGHLASLLGLTETREAGEDELSKYSSRVQCVVDCYGPVDLVAMMRSASAPIVKGFVGKPLEGNEELYRRVSATSYVTKDPPPPPFLIAHGTKDVGTSRGQVPIEQSVDFAEQLKKAGGEATLLKLEGAGHGFTGGGRNKYAQQTLEAAVEFFDKHLGKKAERP
jgi:acetyl esterase/lipase